MQSLPTSRRPVRFALSRRALQDAIGLVCGGLLVWWLLETAGVAAHVISTIAGRPGSGLEGLLLACVMTLAGFSIFALRRWSDAVAAERIAAHRGHQDPLTRLANRRAYVKRLLDMCQRQPERGFSILLMDLDAFKSVNDIYGHIVGDKVLQAFVDAANEVINDEGLFARLGGDEFVLLWDRGNARTDEEMALALARCAERISKVDGYSVSFGLSTGLIRVPDHGSDPVELMRCADLALYEAKRRPGQRFHVFTQALDDARQKQHEIALALRDAVENGELKPFYQPIVDLKTQKVRALEVLARWMSPSLGSISPDVFIPLAIKEQMIGELSLKIMRLAFLDAARWPDDVSIAINISPVTFADSDFPAALNALASECAMPLKRLVVELTEETVMRDYDRLEQTAAALKQMGVALALDDFGSGYACLRPLQAMKFDHLKIDRRYIDRIALCPDARRLVEAVVRLGHSLGISVVAEGVETADQARLLALIQCEFVQGWAYSKAVPADAVPATLDRLGWARLSHDAA